jgi:hypothetical protein
MGLPRLDAEENRALPERKSSDINAQSATSFMHPRPQPRSGPSTRVRPVP